MKKILLALLFVLILPTSLSAAAVNVPASCSVVDTDGATHTYTGYLGVCALVAAKDAGIVSAYTFENFSFGLFLQSLNGIAPGATEFWALEHNGADPGVGLTALTVAAGDELSFQLTDWSSGTEVGAPVEFSIESLVTNAPPPSGGLTFYAPDFDPSKAVLFLKSVQSVDGAMPNALLSDWAAFAFTSHPIGDMRARLTSYFRTWKPELSTVTDYERHAMALLALGLDPYTTAGRDHITPIVQAFDGRQVGDPALINDDIFAVFPLLHAGYRASDEMMTKIRDAIIAAQKQDGSFEGSVDLTAAAMQALALFERTGATYMALIKAENFLDDSQKDDGGWGSSFSTAWALQGITAKGDSHINWTRGQHNSPRYYFAERQQKDGGVEETDVDSFTRLWATAYAVPALMGRTWDSLMASFPKPAPPEPTPPAPLSETAQKAPESPEPLSAVETEKLEEIKTEEKKDDARESGPAETEAATTESAPDLLQTAAAGAVRGDYALWLWLIGVIIVGGLAFYIARFPR